MKAEDLVQAPPEHSYGAQEPIAFDDPKIAFVTERCRGKRVLDLGCVMHDAKARLSRYWLHRAIVEVASETVGMDLSTNGIAELKEAGYNVVWGDAENFTFDRQFDVIVVGDLIEHLGNPGGFLASAEKVLAPGGTIIVQTPNPWYWRNVVKSILHYEVDNNPEHTCWFDPRTLRQLGARFDLTLGKIAFHSRFARDLYMPLPRGVKHTSWSAELVRA